MKKKNLILLVIAAGILVVLAALTSRKEPAKAPSPAGRPVWPDFPINDVARFEILSPEGTCTLARVNEVWVAPDRYQYPADFSKIRDLLLKMRDLKIGEVRKVSEAQRKTLKLVAPDAVPDEERAAAGTLARFYDASGKLLASLLIGESRERSARGSPYGGFPDGKFVSPDGGPTVYVVADSLYEVSRQIRDWLDSEIVNVPSSEILDIRIHHPQGPDVHLTRERTGDSFRLADLAEHEELDTSRLYSVESALSYLRMEDLADPALPDEKLGFDTSVVFTATSVTGLIYTVKVGGCPEGSPNRYARFEIALRPDGSPPPEATSTNGDAEAEARKAAEERARREQEAKSRHERLRTWTFVIPSYKAEGMTRTRADLVKEKAKPQETATPADQTPAQDPTGSQPETKTSEPTGETPAATPARESAPSTPAPGGETPEVQSQDAATP